MIFQISFGSDIFYNN